MALSGVYEVHTRILVGKREGSRPVGTTEQ